MPADETRYPITDFGAGGSGTDTAAFRDAIAACSAAGGGTVLVPPGEYETGTVELQSDITLHLDPGATVAAALDRSEYRPEPIGPDGERVFLHADEVENVALTGRGTFHGRGTECMRMDTPIEGHSGEASEYPLITSGEPNPRQGETYLDRSKGTDDWPVAKPDFRPGPMFLFENCENVLVRDLTMRDMPAWTIGLENTVEADITNVDVRGNKYIPNNDGIAISDSRNVHISDCTLITCDDSITLNGGHGDPCENITVTNCTLESNACAIKFGSGTEGIMRNFTFENIVIQASNRGLGIQHRDSGTLENVLFSNIVIQTRLLSGPWWGKAEPIYVTCLPRDSGTEPGTVRNIRFSNILANSENGALIYASAESTIENVSLEDVQIELSGGENSDRVGGNFDLQPTAAKTAIVEHDIPAVHVEGVDGVDLSGLTIEWAEELPEYYSHGIACKETNDVSIDGFDGRQAHRESPEAAIALRTVETASIRNSRATPGTGVFLETSGVRDPRLFTGNDLSDSDTTGLQEAGFEASGNRLE